MPRVHQARANKDYEREGIKKGDQYYWFKTRFGPKVRSLQPPKPSQLTNSDFLRSLYTLREYVHDTGIFTEQDAQDIRENIEELLRDTDGSLDNMPPGLLESPVGEMLQERADKLQEYLDALEDLQWNPEEYEDPEEDFTEADLIEENSATIIDLFPDL